jgi:hypothetical protein
MMMMMMMMITTTTIDLRYDWCPDAYFCVKTVAVSIVMVATDAAGRICEVNQRMVDRALSISRRTSSLLTPVSWPAGSCFAWLQSL